MHGGFFKFVVTLLLLGGPALAQDVARAEVLARLATPEAATVTFELTGSTEAAHTFDAAFETGGRIVELDVKVGEAVKQGQVLARLDTVQRQAVLDAARAAERAAAARLDEADTTLTRQQGLFERGATTQRSVDNASASRRVAQGQLDVARADVTRAEDALDNSVLRAQVAGIVTDRIAEAGEVVQAGSPVVRIAEDGQRRAVFDVYESALLSVDPDVPIELQLLSNGQGTFTGRIDEIAPLVLPATGTITVRVVIEGASESVPLGVPIVARVRSTAKNVVVLPATALTMSGNGPAVWVVAPPENRLQLRPVEIDAFTSDSVTIRSGLQPDDRVVTLGPRGLREGQAVTIRQEGDR